MNHTPDDTSVTEAADTETAAQPEEDEADTEPTYVPWEPEQKHGPLWHLIDNAFTWSANREKHCVNRKKYLRLCWLGIFGAHRFYSKRYILGVLYLAMCWTGFSVGMTLIDAMIAIPMKPDENGNIWL